MNRRVWVRSRSVLLGSGLFTLAGLAVARGQTKPAAPLPPPIPPSDKLALNAAPFAASPIRTSIDVAVANIQSVDPAARSAAREWLVANCNRAATPSPSYVDVYGGQLSAAVLPVLQASDTPWPVRFNIAVAVSDVAETRPAALTPAVLKLLADKDSAISYRGMRAAGPLVLSLFTPAPPRPDTYKLIPAVVDAAKAQRQVSPPPTVAGGPREAGLGGLIVTEAYAAMVITPTNYPAMTVQQLQPLTDPILDVLEFRIKSYEAGLPLEPGAEAPIFTFLQNQYRSGGGSDDQRHRIVQELVDYCAVAGQRANLASPQELRLLVDPVKNAAQALTILTGGGPGLNTLGSMTRTATVAQLSGGTTLVYGTVSGKAPFTYVKEPPKLNPMDPPPAAPAKTGPPAGTGAVAGQ